MYKIIWQEKHIYAVLTTNVFAANVGEALLFRIHEIGIARIVNDGILALLIKMQNDAVRSKVVVGGSYYFLNQLLGKAPAPVRMHAVVQKNCNMEARLPKEARRGFFKP
ncbi:MAG: hypothetical protein ACKVU2_08400 [Saprospiraceae bacterium]